MANQPSPACGSFTKHRTLASVGDEVTIPAHATGVTIAELSPFGDMVQISWLEGPGFPDKGAENIGTVYEHRAPFTEDEPVEIPFSAMAVTIYEPADSDETIVYWLN